MQPTTTTIQNFAFALPNNSASKIGTSIVNPMPTTVVTLSLQNKILVNGEYICAVGYTAPIQLSTVTN